MPQYRYAVSTADDAPSTAPILLTQGSLYRNLVMAAQLGYDAIEVHMRENAPVDYCRVADICEQYNVGIAAVVTGRLATQEHVSLTALSEKDAQRAREGVRKYVDIADRFRTDIIIGWIRGSVPESMSRDDYEKRLADALEQLSVYAKGKGVRIIIEAINRYEINTMNSAAETLGFIEKYGLDNVYVHLDTFHMNIEEVDMAAAITLCGERLGYVHVADSNRRYPGAGHIDFNAIFEALDEIGYMGCISVECLPYPDHVTAATNAINNIKSIMNK